MGQLLPCGVEMRENLAFFPLFRDIVRIRDVLSDWIDRIECIFREITAEPEKGKSF